MKFKYCEIKYKANIEPHDEEEKLNLYSNHMHKHFEVFILLSPFRSYIIENKTYYLNPYDIVLIRPTKYHFVVDDSSLTEYRRIVIHFTPENTSDIDGLLGDKGFVNGKKNLMLSNWIDMVINYIQNFSEAQMRFLTESLVVQALMLISMADQPITIPFKVNDQLTSIINFITNNLDKPITLKMLSEEFNLTENYISQYFKKKFKMPIIAYAKSKQLFKAHELITNGENPTNVYYQVGFNDYSNFYRAYKKFFGIVPSKT